MTQKLLTLHTTLPVVCNCVRVSDIYSLVQNKFEASLVGSRVGSAQSPFNAVSTHPHVTAAVSRHVAELLLLLLLLLLRLLG